MACRKIREEMEAGYGTTDFWPGQKDRTQDRAKVSGRRDGFRMFWRQNHQGYGWMRGQLDRQKLLA